MVAFGVAYSAVYLPELSCRLPPTKKRNKIKDVTITITGEFSTNKENDQDQ